MGVLTKDRAICLRAVDYSETSQVVTLFARQSGKVRAIAKGSKRPKSAFDGPLEPLSFGEIVFSGVHKDTLATLTEFQSQPVRGEVRRNLAALQNALLAAELLDLLTEEYDPHPALFDHVLEFLQDIEEGRAGPDRRGLLVRLILFQFALLHEVGLRPTLNACVNCRRPVAVDRRASYFSSTANGLVCRDCEMNFPDKIRLSPKAAHCLVDLGRIAQADQATLDEIEQVLIHHFTHILGHPPKTAAHLLNA
ncbi:MAG: DNA repair protein RecO [Planctomycetes bacterium]|jgi:DNA repair protein RecO (recombination protein O)|nr:DNA repair protein RecO [Planctomycetota bacterium]